MKISIKLTLTNYAEEDNENDYDSGVGVGDDDGKVGKVFIPAKWPIRVGAYPGLA